MVQAAKGKESLLKLVELFWQTINLSAQAGSTLWLIAWEGGGVVEREEDEDTKTRRRREAKGKDWGRRVSFFVRGLIQQRCQGPRMGMNETDGGHMRRDREVEVCQENRRDLRVIIPQRVQMGEVPQGMPPL